MTVPRSGGLGFLAYSSGCSESDYFQVKAGKALPGKVMDTNPQVTIG